MPFRDYYLYTLDELIEDELRYYTDRRYAIRYAKKRLRMYANLFTRDCRKFILNKDSKCLYCASPEKLELDHIIPVTKGGKNLVSNLQVLCRKCNGLKNNKI